MACRSSAGRGLELWLQGLSRAVGIKKNYDYTWLARPVGIRGDNKCIWLRSAVHIKGS